MKVEQYFLFKDVTKSKKLCDITSIFMILYEIEEMIISDHNLRQLL